MKHTTLGIEVLISITPVLQSKGFMWENRVGTFLKKLTKISVSPLSTFATGKIQSTSCSMMRRSVLGITGL